MSACSSKGIDCGACVVAGAQGGVDTRVDDTDVAGADICERIGGGIDDCTRHIIENQSYSSSIT